MTYDPHQHMRDNPPRKQTVWDHRMQQHGSRSTPAASSIGRIITQIERSKK